MHGISENKGPPFWLLLKWLPELEGKHFEEGDGNAEFAQGTKIATSPQVDKQGDNLFRDKGKTKMNAEKKDEEEKGNWPLFGKPVVVEVAEEEGGNGFSLSRSHSRQ